MMTTQSRQALLSLLITTMTAFLIAFALRPELTNDPKPPDDVEAMAAWIARHPADWHTASELTDAALDSTLPRRFELWRASYALAHRLAPLRTNATAGFVRAGLFHWYELGASDRKAVLDAAAPLLRDPRIFNALHQPLWQLTRDLTYLRRFAPDTLDSVYLLRSLAVANGRFADYRELRAAVHRKRLALFDSTAATKTLPDIVDLLPQHIEAADAPLVRRVLQELDRRPADVAAMNGERLEGLAEFVLHHDVEPLGGLEPLLEAHEKLRGVTRARLALRLDRPAVASRIELTSAVTGAAEWVPYRVERALYEARHGRTAAAWAQLADATLGGARPDVLAAAAEVATLAGDAKSAAQYRQQLASLPRQWQNTCSPNELCSSVNTETWGNAVQITLSVVQSDEIPPYVEVYVDDVLAAEGEVTDERTFTVDNAGPGLHRVEVRLVNRVMRNGTQRRLRIA